MLHETQVTEMGRGSEWACWTVLLGEVVLSLGRVGHNMFEEY